MYEYVGFSEWKQSSVYDLATWKNGLAFKNINFSDTGRPIIKIAELKNGVTMQTARTMTEYDPSVFVESGDMLFSWSGNPDTSIDVFRWEGEEGWLNQHIFKVTPREIISEEFLFFVLRWLKPRFAAIARNKQTTGLGHVTIADLNRMMVGVPIPSEQDAIVNVVGPIQSQIDLNRRMNETLEEMAQAIFRDWFVDFGPTRRKMAGATDPVAILGGLTPNPEKAAALASLFPAALGDNGLPEGWEEKSLDQIANFLNGLALQKYPADNPADSLPVIKIAELRNGVTVKSNRASREIPGKYIINDGDFIFSWSGSLMAKFWTEGEGALNQHLFKVFSDNYPSWFYAQWVHHHLSEFQQIAASKATTMGHIQRNHLKAAMTICPPDGVLSQLGKIMQPLVQKTIQNNLENRTLATTCDFLLPKLMSGEINLRDTAMVT